MATFADIPLTMQIQHNMETSCKPAQIETVLHDDLRQYLLSLGRIDEHFPEAPDIEGLWPKVAESYMADGIREFGDSPVVSLAWMMYTGMALAKYWDTDWQLYSQVDDLYAYLRDQRGFDRMDDYICEQVLLLPAADHERLTHVAGECGARVYSFLVRQRLEPGTREAFEAYVAAIHQMYLMGMAMELKTLGYHMTKMG
jgi:hypothetical protein